MNDFLYNRRKELGYTLEQVGEMVGVGKSTVRKWEKGMIENMGRDKIVALSKALDISPLDILDIDFQDFSSDITPIYNQLDDSRKEKVYSYAERQLNEQRTVISFPVSGKTAAGTDPITYGDPDIEHKDFSSVPACADVALVVSGDSMEPTISDGDIVFYKQQPTVENGEIAIIEVEGEGVTCKRVKYDFENEKVILQSENDKYEDMVLEDRQIRILGKVIL